MAVVLLLLSLPAAAADNVYIVRDVPADVTAATADEARRTAIARAEAEAWRRLVLRLVVPGQEGRVTDPGPDALEGLVQGLDITDERLTAERYRALVTVRFRGDAVRDLLDRAGVEHAMKPSPLLLVLPVLAGGAAPSLWDETNDWLRAWQQQAGGGKVVDIVVPFADLEDIQAIDGERAQAGDWDAMQRIMSRYEADGVLVAEATPDGDGYDLVVDWYEGPQAHPVAIAGASAAGGIVLIKPGQSSGIEVAPTDSTAGTSEAATSAAPDAAGLEAAVALVRRSVDEQWTVVSTVPQGPEETLIADVAIRSLAEWVDIRGRLERTAAIRQIVPLVIASGKVRVELTYNGDPETLGRALGQSGLALEFQGANWLILPQ